MSEWFETLEDRVWLPPDEEGAEEACFIKKLLRLRQEQAVLDAPCGAGRIAFHLARAGCSVTGVDLRRQFVDRARRRFARAHLRGTFQVMDLREVEFADEFHGIYNWHGSFGYFSDQENAELIRRYVRALCNGGRLLIEQTNRERILRTFIPAREDGPIVTRNYWNRDTQRVEGHRIIDGVEDPRNRSSVRLYTPAQIRRLFEQAGLLIEDIYGYPGAGKFDRSSRRMIAVGRKP